MRFAVPKLNIPVKNFLRQGGYLEIQNPHKSGEVSYARSLDAGRFYPRFHLYPEVRDNADFLNLHLDMKKPSYEGATAHSGEYSGELVEGEAKRIKALAEKFLMIGPSPSQPLGFRPRYSFWKRILSFFKKK